MTTKKLAGYKELPLCVLEDADRLIERLTKQRAELLEALNALYTVGTLNVGELGDDPEVVAAQKKAMQAMENSERDE